MKRMLCSLLTTAALGLIPAAFAQTGPTHDPSMAPPVSQSSAEMPATGQQLAPAPEQGGSPGTRFAALVPAGMSIQDACTGFRSLGECSATLHAAQNLNLPFADLKGKVNGGQSLGAAIHTLRPAANAKAETLKAEKEARDDLSAPAG